MAIPVRLVDSNTGMPLKVNGEGELSATIHTHPPHDEVEQSLPFRQYFTDDGTTSGSNDLRVDGSTTNVSFCVGSLTDYDIYIKTVSILIGDAGARLNLFGAITALTNGIEFTHNTLTSGTTVLHDSIKTNIDFVRLGLNNPAIGAGTNAFRADTSGSGVDTYLPVLKMSETFGLPWGLRIKKNSTDTLCFKIRDDLSTGLDQFDIIAYGIKI